jgi:hypothetical protein
MYIIYVLTVWVSVGNVIVHTKVSSRRYAGARTGSYQDIQSSNIKPKQAIWSPPTIKWTLDLCVDEMLTAKQV